LPFVDPDFRGGLQTQLLYPEKTDAQGEEAKQQKMALCWSMLALGMSIPAIIGA